MAQLMVELASTNAQARRGLCLEASAHIREAEGGGLRVFRVWLAL